MNKWLSILGISRTKQKNSPLVFIWPSGTIYHWSNQAFGHWAICKIKRNKNSHKIKLLVRLDPSFDYSKLTKSKIKPKTTRDRERIYLSING